MSSLSRTRSSPSRRGNSSICARCTPSDLAVRIAEQFNKDPRQVDVVLRESVRIVRMERGILICETRHGFICANAAVDASNVAGGQSVVLLPRDPDGTAARIRAGLKERTGADVAVIITDTFGRPWRTASSTSPSAWPESTR